MSKYLIRHWSGFYICNSGVAFGIQVSQNWLWALITLCLIGFVILNFKFIKTPDVYNPPASLDIRCLAISLILSGAISNILDRLYFGCVIDFIDLRFWPIFNLADTFIVIGVIIAVVQIRTTD